MVTSILELTSAGGSDMGSLRALRALRALRPLRLISRMEGLQVVINTMMRAMKPCASVMAVALVFYTVFAIVGTNLYSGRFYSCTDGSKTCFSGAPGMGEYDDDGSSQNTPGRFPDPIRLAFDLKNSSFYRNQKHEKQSRAWMML